MKYIFTLPIAFLLLFVLFSCQQEAKDILSEEEAKVLMDSYMETMNRADMDLIDEIISSDFVLRTPFLSESLVGIENYKNLVTNTSKTFSDFNANIDEINVKGDKIWCRFSMAGINTGSIGEFDATGKAFNISGLAITRIVNGKIESDETFWDVLGFYQQLGFTLAPPLEQGDKSKNLK